MSRGERSSTRRLRSLVSFLAIAIASGGCFALFSLEEYGPTSENPTEAGPIDAPLGDVIVEATADTGPVTGKVVFVTRSEFRVDSNGVQSTTKADSLCQKAAVDAGLPGTFYAWFSNSSESPSTKFLALRDGGPEAGPAPAPQQLITTDNQIIAKDYAELVDGGPRIALTVTEHRTTLPEAPPKGGSPQSSCPDSGVVWTGTTPAGTSAQPTGGRNPLNPSCFDWQANGPGATAIAGRMAKHPTEWTTACHLTCNSGARLYCFEQ